jgi:RND family efflux transporter MFP subunit
MCAVVAVVVLSGCRQAAVAPKAGGMQAMPVKTVEVSLAPVAQRSEYMGTIMSRRSASMQPQVSGRITQILVHSGDRVKAGQALMSLDAQPQIATVESARATERQKKALYDYNVTEVERQHKLFDAGVISRDAWEQAQQTYANTKADYEASVATRKTDEEQLAYYTVRAPFAGVVGDVPVHVGDFASTTTALTTVDEHQDLEAYIYIPTERSADIRNGLVVEVYATDGTLIEKSAIDFISPQVDSSLQGILVKAPVHTATLRHDQMVKVRVVWTTKPMAVVPVLAVTRQGGQSFVFVVRQQGQGFMAAQVPVVLGDTVENNYSISSGLQAGEKVIVSSTQFLVNGMPVMPLGA